MCNFLWCNCVVCGMMIMKGREKVKLSAGTLPTPCKQAKRPHPTDETLSIVHYTFSIMYCGRV